MATIRDSFIQAKEDKYFDYLSSIEVKGDPSIGSSIIVGLSMVAYAIITAAKILKVD